jgi:ser/thr protein phosphatase
VPLTLTGHTHGSQFGFLGLPLFPVFKYTRGMVRIGDNYGYVHVGNGSWFPLRIGCPPEIAFFRLERKREQ